MIKIDFFKIYFDWLSAQKYSGLGLNGHPQAYLFNGCYRNRGGRLSRRWLKMGFCRGKKFQKIPQGFPLREGHIENKIIYVNI